MFFISEGEMPVHERVGVSDERQKEIAFTALILSTNFDISEDTDFLPYSTVFFAVCEPETAGEAYLAGIASERRNFFSQSKFVTKAANVSRCCQYSGDQIFMECLSKCEQYAKQEGLHWRLTELINLYNDQD